MHADSLRLLDEREGTTTTFDTTGHAVDIKGASLHLMDGSRFFAPSPILTVAVHSHSVVAGAQSGELYFLEIQGDK